MIDAPAPVTAADLLAKSKDSSHRYELMKGNLLTLSLANADHGAIALTIGATIHLFAEDHCSGSAFGSGAGFLLTRNPDTVRAPATSPARPTWPWRWSRPATQPARSRRRCRCGSPKSPDQT
jgi:Uma2 family endonuclease